MTRIYPFQLLTHLALVLWIGVFPPANRLGFTILAASLLALAAMALLGIWLLPPGWAPFCFGLAFGVAAWVGSSRRRPFASAMPGTWRAWTATALFGALGAASACAATIAPHSRSPPSPKTVHLAFPLERGQCLVVNGGSDISTNAHVRTLDANKPRFTAWRGQSYGVDLVKLGSLGLRASGVQPADPGAYRIYGARVPAPCAGQVVLVVDGLPDMRVPEVDRDHLAGNHVMLRCTQATVHAAADADVLLGHLQPGTVRVAAGATVAVGDWLGSVGNSGNTGEPHLHIHAQGPGPAGAPLSGDPLAIVFASGFPVRGDRIESP